jgi:endogenous inhibitor of DNA gyrase (YacG/DUF329 family)
MPPSDAAPRPEAIHSRGRLCHICPICRRPVARDAKSFPFCSERCKLVDLGRWLDGQYRIELPLDAFEGDTAGSGPPDDESLSEGTQ